MSGYIISYFISYVLLSSDAQNYSIHDKVKSMERVVYKAGCQKYFNNSYHYQFMKINTVSFDDSIVEDANKGITKFEMRFSIKITDGAYIMLSSNHDPKHKDLAYEMGIVHSIRGAVTTTLSLTKQGNKHAVPFNKTIMHRVDDSGYSHWHLLVERGKLQLAHLRRRATMLIFEDIRLRYVKYFGVTSSGPGYAKILFDCELPFA